MKPNPENDAPTALAVIDDAELVRRSARALWLAALGAGGTPATAQREAVKAAWHTFNVEVRAALRNAKASESDRRYVSGLLAAIRPLESWTDLQCRQYAESLQPAIAEVVTALANCSRRGPSARNQKRTERCQKARELHNEGLTQDQIARKLRVSEATVSRDLNSPIR